MRTPYKGYLLCADQDLRDKQKIHVGVFHAKTYESIHEEVVMGRKVSQIIAELKDLVLRLEPQNAAGE